MNHLYSTAREITDLSDVQIKILVHMEEALSFAADISKNQVCIFTKGKNKDIFVSLIAISPSYTTGATYLKEGDIFFKEEHVLIDNVFVTGKPVVGRKELSLGRMVALTAYPIFDNAGIPFAVAVFLSHTLKQQRVLTDAAYMALQVPMKKTDYKSLRPQDGMLILDPVGRIMYANDMAEDLYFVLDKETVEKKEIIGHSMIHFPLVDEILTTGKPAYGDEIFGEFTVSAWGMPILSGGRVTRIVIFLSDVTAIREKERQILVKDSVIREIHHRVKNSLNTIAGMLRMQARRSRNEETKKALQTAIDRILGISQIHEILAKQEGDKVEWHEVMKKTIELALTSLSTIKVDLQIKNNAKPIYLNTDKAVPLAIAVNELVHNAIEHGFHQQKKGILIIEEQIQDKQLHIIISNSGEKLPQNFNESNYDLGLQIVKTLSEIELKGHFSITNEKEYVTAYIHCPINQWEERE